ncbi:hypothetical protein P6M73_03625 [Proteiniclasticum sp. QWL-01]|nr:hypothetical protein [Proteiniclasticum sp. QWL-01]WFF73551.1 hypothetical protein P6M73_03625 [Proteiniclasticum sp. QWL-01]
MSKSQKWKQEWQFFLDTDGRRKYNAVCRRCVHPCKQSFRSELLFCPHFSSKRAVGTENCLDKGR